MSSFVIMQYSRQKLHHVPNRKQSKIPIQGFGLESFYVAFFQKNLVKYDLTKFLSKTVKLYLTKFIINLLEFMRQLSDMQTERSKSDAGLSE